MIRVHNPKLITLFQVFVTLGIIYSIFFLIFQRSYMKFTTPNMSILVSIDKDNVSDPIALQKSLVDVFPTYCNASGTFYNYSSSRLYDGAQCIGYMSPTEYTAYSGNSLWINTYFQARTATPLSPVSVPRAAR